ncbi:MAG: hypothetical protein U5R49_26475 [Deltaproteobacteria bacterium]|nr:hypothetical protein [Deltaproteobacteria bacterium]
MKNVPDYFINDPKQTFDLGCDLGCDMGCNLGLNFGDDRFFTGSAKLRHLDDDSENITFDHLGISTAIRLSIPHQLSHA